MLISSIVLGVWGGSKRKMMTVSIGIGVLGVATEITGILPVSMFAVCLLCSFVMGHTAAWFNVPVNFYVQASTDAKDLGKVIPLLFMICTIANPIRLAISGPISEAMKTHKGSAILDGAAFVYRLTFINLFAFM